MNSRREGDPKTGAFARRENQPFTAGHFSRAAKVSCVVRDVFARRESFLRCAGRFRTPRKFPALCRTFSHVAKVSCIVQDVFARRESLFLSI